MEKIKCPDCFNTNFLVDKNLKEVFCPKCGDIIDLDKMHGFIEF